jgi:putative sigma-54 modulation protein
MKLQMHSIHFDADKKLLDYIQKKAEKLDTFYDRITGGEVFLRINKDTNTHENKVVEIKLSVPGHTLFAKEHGTSFEAATDEAMEALKSQIKKFKEKMLERA